MPSSACHSFTTASLSSNSWLAYATLEHVARGSQLALLTKVLATVGQLWNVVVAKSVGASSVLSSVASRGSCTYSAPVSASAANAVALVAMASGSQPAGVAASSATSDENGAASAVYRPRLVSGARLALSAPAGGVPLANAIAGFARSPAQPAPYGTSPPMLSPTPSQMTNGASRALALNVATSVRATPSSESVYTPSTYATSSVLPVSDRANAWRCQREPGSHAPRAPPTTTACDTRGFERRR